MYTHTKRIQEVYAMRKGSWRKAGENAMGEGVSKRKEGDMAMEKEEGEWTRR